MITCPNCNSKNIAYSGTVMEGRKYDKACNYCGYCFNPKDEVYLCMGQPCSECNCIQCKTDCQED